MGSTGKASSREFLSPERLGAGAPPDSAARPSQAGRDRFGSTTHLAVIDEGGVCASVTCSNGTGSGLVVPGTGVHVNNMLGEEDLNPQRIPPHPGRPPDHLDDGSDDRPASTVR